MTREIFDIIAPLNGHSATQQVVFVVVVPPTMTLLWWLASRGWANTVQFGNVSARTKQRQKWEFWAVLALGYGIVAGVVLYAHLAKS